MNLERSQKTNGVIATVVHAMRRARATVGVVEHYGLKFALKAMWRASVLFPDRFIGIAALIFAILFALVPSQNASDRVALLVLVSAASAWILTLQSLRLSPDLYAKTLFPDSTEIDRALLGLFSETAAVLRSVLSAESTSRELRRLEIIHNLKLQIAGLLSVDPKRFCTVILGFSPTTLISRMSKLEENKGVLDDLGTESGEHDKYRARKALQSSQVKNYCASAIEHIEHLLALPLDWAELARFCNAPSSSAALIRYVSILTNLAKASRTEEDLTRNLRKLHRLQYALPVSSPHSLLYGATRLIRLYDPDIDKTIICNRLALLELAIGERGNCPVDQGQWWKRLEKRDAEWSREISDSIMEQREEIWRQFKVELSKVKSDQYVVVDGYSRAVRTVLKHAVVEHKSAGIVFLSYGDERRDNGLRLLAHEVINEPPVGESLDEWREKCRNRIFFTNSTDLPSFSNREGTMFHFVVGTGGILADGGSGRIERGRNKLELAEAIDKLTEMHAQTKVHAVGGAYKHKDVIGAFHENGNSPIEIAEAIKRPYVWQVDEVITSRMDGPDGASTFIKSEYGTNEDSISANRPSGPRAQ